MKRSKENEENEKISEYKIEKLSKVKHIKGIWKILVKCEDYTVNSWESVPNIKKDQP